MSNIDVEAEMDATLHRETSDDARIWAWPFVGAAVFGVLTLATSVPAASMESQTGEQLLMASVFLAFATALCLFVCLFGYYMVAKHQPDEGWQPNWPIWALAHILVTPIAVGWFLVKLHRHRVLRF